MRVAHAELVHVLERVLDVVDAGAALADALRHQARAAMQVELAHVRRVGGVGEKGERVHASARPAEGGAHQARLVDAARHLAVPQAPQRARDLRRRDAKRHAPAGAAAAQPHHQPGLAARAAIAGGEDA
jgi:hypothetical protein